jgi:hypothetical protein
MKHKVNYANPRLSDEEIDPLEIDDLESLSHRLHLDDSLDNLADVLQIVDTKLPAQERKVVEAFLSGKNNEDIKVSKKFWRYHFTKAIMLIKQELGT